MPVTAGLVSGAAQGIGSTLTGLFRGAIGFGQRRKAKKMLASLQRPTYTIPKEVLDTQKQAELMANEGLPSEQYKRASQNIQRAQNRAIQSAMDRRAGLMTVAQGQQVATDAMGDLDIADANQRISNKRYLGDVSGRTAQYRDKAFDVNQMQPYLQKYQYAQSLLGAGNQNLISAGDRLLGSAAGLFGGGGGGGGGLFGGGKPKRSMTAGVPGDPTYHNGYGPDDEYADFEINY